MPKEFWIAFITATASLLAALVSAGFARKALRDVAELNHQLQERRAEFDARRDYEYEAKKRLYTECEPVLFEAMELAENFRRRVASLARSARRGNIAQDGRGWLDAPGYYFKSTIYYLLAPITSHKILHRRLTSIDLALDPRLEYEYHLLKHVFDALTWDHDLAEEEPHIDYSPDAPAVRRQGLYLGVVDQLAEALVVERNGHERCKSLGEFFREFDDPDTDVGRLSPEVAALLTGFHPARHPVLWRVLVSQYLLLGVLLRVRQGMENKLSILLPPVHDRDVEPLDWRSHSAQDASEARTALLIARASLARRLER